MQLVAEAVEDLEHDLAGVEARRRRSWPGSRRRRRRTGSRSWPGCPRSSRPARAGTRSRPGPALLGVRLAGRLLAASSLTSSPALLQVPDAVGAALGAGALLVLALLHLLLVLVAAHHAAERLRRLRHVRSPPPTALAAGRRPPAFGFGFFFGFGFSASRACAISSSVTVLPQLLHLLHDLGELLALGGADPLELQPLRADPRLLQLVPELLHPLDGLPVGVDVVAVGVVAAGDEHHRAPRSGRPRGPSPPRPGPSTWCGSGGCDAGYWMREMPAMSPPA